MAIGLKLVNKDIVLLPQGSLEFITGTEKCSRDFDKMLQTDIEASSNVTNYYRYNPLFGTELNRQELFSGLTMRDSAALVHTLLSQSIKNYLALQETRTNLSPGEIITAVDIKTEPVTDSKGRRIKVTLEVSTLKEEKLNLSQYEVNV